MRTTKSIDPRPVLVVALMIGAALVAWGCARTNLPLYLVGVGVLALTVAVGLVRLARRRRWQIVIAATTAVIVVAAGVAIPSQLARATNHDVAWRADSQLRTRGPITVRGHTYLAARGGHIQVLDSASGAALWSTKGYDFAVGADGSLFTYDDVLGSGDVVAAYRSDGRQMWRADSALQDVKGSSVVARVGGGTVVAICGTHADWYLLTSCRFAGVDDTGTVRWQHRVRYPKAAYLDGDSTRLLSWGSRARLLPSTAAVSSGKGKEAGPYRLTIWDPATGRSLRSVTDPSFGPNGAYLVADTVLTGQSTDRGCRWTAYRGSQQLWSRTSRTLCADNGDPDSPTRVKDANYPGSIQKIVGHRAYLDAGHFSGDHQMLATVDLRTGSYRVLNREETAGSGNSESDSDPQDLMGEDVEVVVRGQTITGLDPSTGDVLWTKHMSEEFTVAPVDRGILLLQSNESHNPFLPVLAGSSDSIRMVLLSRGSGQQIASAVGPDGGYFPNYPHREIGADYAVIAPSNGAPYVIR